MTGTIAWTTSSAGMPGLASLDVVVAFGADAGLPAATLAMTTQGIDLTGKCLF
jgi:hypothetical protein